MRTHVRARTHTHTHTHTHSCLFPRPRLQAATQNIAGNLMGSVQLAPGLGEVLSHLPSMLEAIALWREKILHPWKFNRVKHNDAELQKQVRRHAPPYAHCLPAYPQPWPCVHTRARAHARTHTHTHTHCAQDTSQTRAMHPCPARTITSARPVPRSRQGMTCT